MNTTGTNLGQTPARNDKQKVGPVSSGNSFAPPPMILKSTPSSVFVAPPPLIDNKLARRSYTALQALGPPIAT